MWKNTVERGRLQMAIWRMRIACWRTRAINTHSECVILVAFPLYQWFCESTSVLRHTYIACLISFLVGLLLPTHCRCSGLLLRLVTHSDTYTHTTLGRAPLDERSVRRRDLYLTTQYSRQTDIHTHVGFEPVIPANERPQTLASDRAATGVGHWNIRRCILSFWQIP